MRVPVDSAVLGLPQSGPPVKIVVVSTLEVILKDVINYLQVPSQLHFLPLSQ